MSMGMGRGSMLAAALAALAAASALAIGASPAQAARPLALSAEFESTRVQLEAGSRIKGSASIEASFTVSGRALECESGEPMEFTGEVVSAGAPTDKLLIEPLERNKTIICEAVTAGKGIEALLFEENAKLLVSVSSKGVSHIAGDAEPSRWVLEGRVEGASFSCLDEKASPFTGTNTATTNRELLKFSVPQSRGSSKLRLNRGASTHGCAPSMRVGISSEHLKLNAGGEPIFQQIT